MKKAIKFLSIVLLAILSIFFLISCEKKEPEKNIFDEINPLDEHEMKIVKSMKEKPPKKASPRLIFANQENAVILNHNGIIVINIPYGQIMHAVDNRKIGLNKLEGDNMTVAEVDGHELLIYNLKDKDKKKAIEVDINSLTIKSKPDLKDKNYKKIELMEDKDILNSLSENGKVQIQAIPITDNDILAFKMDSKTNTTNWQICIYDRESLKPVRSFLIFK